MRIQIGTKVKFLNDVGGGIVRGFSDDRYAVVETDDGFEMPVLLNELLIDSSDSSSEGEDDKSGFGGMSVKQQMNKAEAVQFKDKKYIPFKGSVCIAILPQNEQLIHVSSFDLFLINDSNYSFSYCISYKDSGVSTLISSGSIEPDTKLELGEYSQTAISKLREIRLQGIFNKSGLMDAVPTLDRVSGLEKVIFYKIKHFTDNEYFHQKALILQDSKEIEVADMLEKLDKSDFGTLIRKKEEKAEKPQHKSPKNNVLEEIDLHIEEIVEDSSGMSNGEIVNTQMDRFETALQTAMYAKTQKLVFIHGVGNGKLKHELRKTLESKYPDLRYQDASFKEYGYGATLVYLK